MKWIEIIGEATRGLSPEFRGAHPEIPWSGIAGKRNRLVHGYFEIEDDLVWAVVIDELPVLESQVRAILEELE